MLILYTCVYKSSQAATQEFFLKTVIHEDRVNLNPSSIPAKTLFFSKVEHLKLATLLKTGFFQRYLLNILNAF